MIKSYKDLIVWQKSINLVKEVYNETSKLPKSEIYGLVSQMRRSAVSVPSNIAEGNQRSGKKDFVNFLRMAKGSLAELETQMIICKEIYPNIKSEKAFELAEEINKMISTIIKKINDSGN